MDGSTGFDRRSRIHKAESLAGQCSNLSAGSSTPADVGHGYAVAGVNHPARHTVALQRCNPGLKMT
jgi:hypothetical protein